MRRALLVTMIAALHLPATGTRAETIILKDGTFLEGKIAVQTSTMVRVETRFGTRTFNRKDIDQIMEAVDQADPAAGKKFSDLPPAVRAVLNAQADYELKQYDRALSRLEPLRDYQDSKAVRVQIDWLIIEINERLGRWEEAKKLLKEKQERGLPGEKVRAKAHLDLFEVNRDYDLRFVGQKHARNFIFDEGLRNRAKEPGSLRDPQLMRLALEEYCEQLLVEDKLSVKAFADRLNVQTTYDAIKKAPGAGDITNSLPYIEDLKKAEVSLVKAQAILGDYSSAFELDLIRTELNHLLTVFDRFANDAQRVSPETLTPAFDRRSGQLTPDGRRQWQQRCDDFLAAAKPLTRLLDYMRAKVERNPESLRDFRVLLTNLDDRLTEMVRAVKKARDRTHV